MNIIFYNQPFPHLIIDKIYDDVEIKMIYDEMIQLYPHMTADSGGAREDNNPDGKLLKSGVGLFLDKFYANNRESSNIIKLSNKIFNQQVYKSVETSNWFFKYYYFNTNFDSTLVQSYSNNDYYEIHEDYSIFSSVTAIYKTPRQFNGGELVFPTESYEIDLKNNQTIIFPSKIPHKVNSIVKENDDIAYNRFSITKFINFDISISRFDN